MSKPMTEKQKAALIKIAEDVRTNVNFLRQIMNQFDLPMEGPDNLAGYAQATCNICAEAPVTK